MSCDLLVVGGGIVGTSVAYFAAREGLSVTLLEKRELAFGASGRNPGFVWLHCRNPGFALEISRAGRALYPQLLEDLPEPFEFRAEGGMIYFTTPEQGAVFEEFVAARRADGVEMELIDGAAVRALAPPIRPDVLGASFSPEDAQINTPTVVRALGIGARAEGADIREGVEVTALRFDGDRVVGVATDHGDVDADRVVVCAGAWSSALLADCGVEIPVGAERLQVIALEPQPLQIGPVVYGALAAKQYTLFRHLPSWDPAAFTREYESEEGFEMLQLVAQRANGEILLGCPMDYPPSIDMRPTLHGIGVAIQSMVEDFPGLRDAAVSRVWAGALPYTTDMAPVIDEVRPGLLVAAGHVFGNAAGPMTGKIIAQMIQGREPEIDLSECRHDRVLQRTDTGLPARW
ncbi:MAG: dependent oxidoreductase [Conexibacter sp.]|nr:dependent oxidoreductase [Conexibacter sp.]